MNKIIEIAQSENRVIFTPESSGIPASVSVKEFDGERILVPGGFELSMEVENIGRIQPGASLCEPEHYFQNGAEVLEFSRLGWVDLAGNRVSGEYSLEFRNQLESDRSQITFDLEIC